MKNPLTGKKMPRDTADYVRQLRTVRRNAKTAARSGNPARREPAKKVLRRVGPTIGTVYVQDAERRRREKRRKELLRNARKAGLR